MTTLFHFRLAKNIKQNENMDHHALLPLCRLVVVV